MPLTLRPTASGLSSNGLIHRLEETVSDVNAGLRSDLENTIIMTTGSRCLFATIQSTSFARFRHILSRSTAWDFELMQSNLTSLRPCTIHFLDI
ncbi:unnamed protein product [Aspergillus oryzae]|uniref:Unnamed protein product n=2 Tax=Aspergillus oryzae TaxID=5062 RepID=A0AAN5BSN5_ASPOZ|nr:unnamed protein product [Aspergillus oryzae]GMF93681.1 unnamed protein product [Aspergillus oryzae]GMG08887.1 unnamed protein product [Aspergillus oryzae]GMG24773.1 unnamed protein product [Aspergillus oryzae]GMG50405.1 unnamed protein product [Aspergillus oryzae var. brunneus]